MARLFFSTAIMVALPLFVAADWSAIESFSPVTRPGVYLFFRYGKRPAEQDPLQVHGNKNIEKLAFGRTAPGAMFLAVLIGALVSRDGRSNWFKGVQLIPVSVIMAFSFFFTPKGAPR